MTASTAMAVSAADIELNKDNQDGTTEVTAVIKSSTPGSVSYIITIPEKVDFGELTKPDNNIDDYKEVKYTVTATKLEGLTGTQNIAAYVKDENASVNGDQYFYIKNKADPTKKFKYSVFDVADSALTDSSVPLDSRTMTLSIGYHLHGFKTEGESVTGTLRLNQNQLFNYNLSSIVGEYSGHMVFYSMISDN